MKLLENIAVLIDADNTQLSRLESVLQVVSTKGRIIVKRAYGNWHKEELKHWEGELKRLAIKAEQQFDYTTGKNATDMALVIDAITLLHRSLYDAFVIVSSDSDFTPLAIHLRESGVYVMGVGREATPEAFRNSCDDFIFIDHLDDLKNADEDTPEPVPEAADVTPAKQPESRGADNQPGEETASREKKPGRTKKIHKLLRIASEQYSDNNGYTPLGQAGTYIKRVQPDFDIRTYGYNKLVKLLEAFPQLYTVRKSKLNVYYQCK
ncbi:MAG: NYN domain-containing protein [Schwartzia sp.]|nr:NYN domain-containing protein [Schwartzia sp. (in: firmicutes)]